MVDHDMTLVMGLCRDITVLDFGRIIAKGTSGQIRSGPSVIEAYLGAPTGVDVSSGDCRAEP